MNTKVDEALVEAIQPDSLICAIGATPIVPNIPGIDDPRVIYCSELAKLTPNVGQRVVIIGGGLVGAETAIHFRQEDKHVTLLEARDDIAIDANAFHKMGLDIELRDSINLHVNSRVEAITEEGVVAVDTSGQQHVFPADTIFCAVGMKSRADEREALRRSIIDFWPIGDCVRPGKAAAAIHHGHYAGIDI
ncbi:FAD-dependent oxidoreductase [Vibrio sp. PP-XX7]